MHFCFDRFKSNLNVLIHSDALSKDLRDRARAFSEEDFEADELYDFFCQLCSEDNLNNGKISKLYYDVIDIKQYERPV